MIYETIEYGENQFFSIEFSNVRSEGRHCHKDMEISYLLRGEATYQIHHQEFSLKEGEMVIVDTDDLHYISRASEDVLMVTLHIDILPFADMYPNIEYMIFACENLAKGTGAQVGEAHKQQKILKEQLLKIMESTGAGQLRESKQQVDDFIFNLVNQFKSFYIEEKQFKLKTVQAKDLEVERLYGITKYLYTNYDKKISLDDIAKLEHLSPYYISHLIKDTSGLSFQEFLNYIRMEYGEKFLVAGELSLTEISEHCGFSSLSYFNKCFKSWHGITPAQYRKNLKKRERTYSLEFTREEAYKLLESHRENLKIYEGKQMSKHVFLPIPYKKFTGKTFSFKHSLVIYKEEDLLKLPLYKEYLEQLKIGSIKLHKNIYDNCKGQRDLIRMKEQMEVLGFTVAKGPSTLAWDEGHGPQVTHGKALSEMMAHPHKEIFLFGKNNSLFSEEGIITPYFALFKSLSSVEGKMVRYLEDHVIIKEDDIIHIFIHKSQKDSHSKVHVQLEPFPQKCFVSEVTYLREHNGLSYLENLGDIDYLRETMKRDINEKTKGNSSLYLADKKEGEIIITAQSGALKYIKLFLL